MNRRSFLKTAATTPGALSVLPLMNASCSKKATERLFASQISANILLCVKPPHFFLTFFRRKNRSCSDAKKKSA